MNAMDIMSEGLFVGSYHHSLDPKRRLIVPSPWRPLLGASPRLYVFPHPDSACLYLYSTAEMYRRLAQLRAGGAGADVEQAVRAMTASADALIADAQGRVRIKDELLAHAEVKSRVVMVGTFSRIELWSEEKYDMALPVVSTVAEDAIYGGF